MAILRKRLNRSTRSGIASRDYKHIRLALTGKAAIILLFILSGSSAAQPRATIRPDSRAVPLNRQLRVTLELTWTGDADAYDVPQSDVSALAEFEIAERGLSAERKNETNVLRFGGLVPSPEQLDWAEKTVKKAIRAAFPVEDESE